MLPAGWKLPSARVPPGTPQDGSSPNPTRGIIILCHYQPCQMGQSREIAPGGETLLFLLPSTAFHTIKLCGLRCLCCAAAGARCQARGLVPGLSGAFPLSAEFIVIHNGIITNYKDLRKFLVSDPGVCVTLTPSHSLLLPHASPLTPPLVFSRSVSHSHSPTHIPTPPLTFALFMFPPSYFCTHTPLLTLSHCYSEHILTLIPHSLPTSLTLAHSPSPSH